MLEKPTGDHYGLELSRKAGLASGTIYPLLRRLEVSGWVTSAWEDVDPSAEGRPRKRLYTLTGEGERAARLYLAEARKKLSLPSITAPGPAFS